MVEDYTIKSLWEEFPNALAVKHDRYDKTYVLVEHKGHVEHYFIEIGEDHDSYEHDVVDEGIWYEIPYI